MYDAIRQPGDLLLPRAPQQLLAGLARLGVRRLLRRHGFGFRELVVVVAAEEEEADRVPQSLLARDLLAHGQGREQN